MEMFFEMATASVLTFVCLLVSKITSVVPQPIVRGSDVIDGLTQDAMSSKFILTETKLLDADSVQNENHYKRITIDQPELMVLVVKDTNERCL